MEDYEKGSFLVVEPEQEVSGAAVKALLEDDAVVYASPDYVVTANPTQRVDVAQAAATGTIPNDPLLNQLWGMRNIRVTDVWPTLREAPRVIVAVIDTGVDYNHPDLRKHGESNMIRWFYRAIAFWRDRARSERVCT